MSALPSPDPVSPYILLGMTATTGIVDAVSLLALGHVFTATGNVLFLSFALAGAQGFSIPRSSMALIAFLLGAAGGRAIGNPNDFRPPPLLDQRGLLYRRIFVDGRSASIARVKEPGRRGLHPSP